ncbi:aminoglycoside phosphotransferase family protein [Bradyrhizobium sp. INPA01-394B]|uniref:Aminoglycoside phosphotransferase family protein n=1 Tax=Bradyrhizobium campsiandrae TaxID=1729892 RepID=A0ABR7UBS8_9BRAD|nr:aminoglycoside phosphotransferase family protein [Bradyrhizobium campsiandrae]MBC9880488.1 aminoglycoside phosphotransferase family protein [Bradyrhizobium campsiandrae]MBC9980971.1 aminoglycoside phosphotransferase family protein [Bradyrhizobium campsiandrae]
MSSEAPLQLKPRLEISIDQARAIVRQISPDASVLSLTELHGGEISTVLEIALVDAPACILKVYPESLQWKMAKEVYVLGLLRDLGTTIPKILLADDTRSVVDLNYVLMTRLDGTVLGRREAALSEAGLFSIYAEMGAALRGINHVTLDSFGYIGPNGVWTAYPTNRAYMSAQLDRKLKEFCARGGDPALAERLRDSVEARQHLFEAATTPRLCHYDFHAGNVLVTSRGEPHLTGIVDFENATSGDPLLDIAKALYYFTAKDAPKRDGLLAGYGPIERPDWQQTLDLYRIYCTLELWCWMAQIGKREVLADLTRELAAAS